MVGFLLRFDSAVHIPLPFLLVMLDFRKNFWSFSVALILFLKLLCGKLIFLKGTKVFDVCIG